MRALRAAVRLAGGLVLAGCGGQIAGPSPSGAGGSGADAPAAGSPAPPPAGGATPAPATPVPAAPPGPPAEGWSEATRDGVDLSIQMCSVPRGGSLEIWGEVTDPTFVVDEAIIDIRVSPATLRGPIPCTPEGIPGAHVLFAEARGAEFPVDPSTCTFDLATDATTGLLTGHLAAEYLDHAQARHHFTVDFAAGACR